MAIEFNPYSFPQMREFKKPTTVLDAFKEVAPLAETAAKDVAAYNAKQARQKEINDAIENGNAGWYNAEDPASVAAVDEYVRTGNSSGLANLKNAWQSTQDRIKQEAANQAALSAAKAEAEKEKIEGQQKEQQQKDYSNQWEKAKFNFENKLAEIENNKTPGFDKEAAVQQEIKNLLEQGFSESDIYSYLNNKNYMRQFIGEQTAKTTKPKAPEAPKPKLTIKKK